MKDLFAAFLERNVQCMQHEQDAWVQHLQSIAEVTEDTDDNFDNFPIARGK